MHRLEGVGTAARVAFGQFDEQPSRGRRGGRQQWMGDDGDPALRVDRGNRLGEGQTGGHEGGEADPQQVPLLGGDLLADHQPDRDPFVPRPSDKPVGHINAIVVGKDGDLQITRTERRIHGPRHLDAERIAAGMDMEVRVSDGWIRGERMRPSTSRPAPRQGRPLAALASASTERRANSACDSTRSAAAAFSSSCASVRAPGIATVLGWWSSQARATWACVA